MKHQKALGNGMLLITAIIWGTAFVAQRVGMDHIGPITFTAARMVLAAVAVGTVALATGRRSASERNREKAATRRRATVKGGVLCGVFLALATIFQQMGLVTTTAGKAGFVTAMYILLVPLLGSLFFKKKNSWLVWTAVLLGVAGMYLLCVTEGLRLTRGDSLVCVSALIFSFHILCCDRFAPQGNPIGISAIQFLTAALVSAVAALLSEEPRGEQLLSAAVPILYCGLISGGVGYTLQIVAQQFTDPTVASLLMSMESVFAVLAGVLLLKETMSLRELMGSLLMFTAIVLVQLPHGQSFSGESPGHGEDKKQTEGRWIWRLDPRLFSCHLPGACYHAPVPSWPHPVAFRSLSPLPVPESSENLSKGVSNNGISSHSGDLSRFYQPGATRLPSGLRLARHADGLSRALLLRGLCIHDHLLHDHHLLSAEPPAHPPA